MVTREEVEVLEVPPRIKAELIAAERYKAHIVSKGINPALKQCLQECRRGELHPKNERWKNFDLHDISNAVRHGGPYMHVTFAKMHDGFLHNCDQILLGVLNL